MDAKEKYNLLKYCETLGNIFISYKEYVDLDIKDLDLKIKFLSFLEELLQDGSIRLSDFRENPEKILIGSPREQVAELDAVWPTMEEMMEYFPEDPWYYLEWVWWRATCPIELSRLPEIEIYQSHTNY